MPMGDNSRAAQGGKSRMAAAGAWPTERWVAIIVISALLLLIAIRMGFRGVGFMGARVSVS